jgi:transcriptional regulator with XRE-family HTH domain
MGKTIYSDDHSRLVARLKKARAESGLTQIAVAELLGRTQSYVSKVEKGQRQVDIVELKQFASVYKKNIDFFLR